MYREQCARGVRNSMLLASTCAFSPLALSQAALAQELAAGAAEAVVQSEDIVVTARQRNETLISSPVAISAIGADQLQKLGMSDIRDVARLVPSLTLDRKVASVKVV